MKTWPRLSFKVALFTTFFQDLSREADRTSPVTRKNGLIRNGLSSFYSKKWQNSELFTWWLSFSALRASTREDPLVDHMGSWRSGNLENLTNLKHFKMPTGGESILLPSCVNYKMPNSLQKRTGSAFQPSSHIVQVLSSFGCLKIWACWSHTLWFDTTGW